MQRRRAGVRRRDVNLELVGRGETGTWLWPQPDQSTVPVDNVLTIDVEVTQNGVITPAQAHVALIEGQWRWFTHCVP